MPSKCQEPVSKCSLKAAAEDDGAGELDKREVELGPTLVADVDPTPVVQPGVRALDRPALGHLRIANATLASRPAADDPWLDPALAQRGAQVLGVVAAVGQQRVGTVVEPAATGAQGRDRIDEREQVATLVLVGAAEGDR